MDDPYLGPTIKEEDIASELLIRGRPTYKTVRASSMEDVWKKVELAEKDGWQFDKINPKSVRMIKPKPLSEELEDEIWCILAKMGFKEMSQGHKFKIALQENLPPRQIDVFAKDDETVILVECTTRKTRGKKNMESLINKAGMIQTNIYPVIHKKYGRMMKLRFKCVIATRNIVWTDTDRKRCENQQIKIITDDEIDYYMRLVDSLKHAARYQFLAHLFSGQKVDGLAKEIVATQGKMGGTTFYTFLIRPDDLLKIAYVGHKASRSVESVDTYQRLLDSTRLQEIAEYIKSGKRFPTNVVVNIKTPGKAKIRFKKIKKIKESIDDSLVILQLPALYASAWIIDGQHRLYGYAYAKDSGFKEDKTVLPVLAFDNLPAEDEIRLFIDINSEQVNVRTDHLFELYSDLHWNSPDPEEAFVALHCRVASELNSRVNSPFYDRMVVAGTQKTSYRCLTLTSIKDGLEHARLLGTFSRANKKIDLGPLSTDQDDNYQSHLEKCVIVLSKCFDMFKENLEDYWNKGDKPDGGYVCTNNGVRALFHVIQYIVAFVEWKGSPSHKTLSAEQTFRNVEPFLKILLDIFGASNLQMVEELKGLGSSVVSVKRQSLRLAAEIKSIKPEFDAPGLQDFIEARERELRKRFVDDAQIKVTRINQIVSDYVLTTLQDEYGTEGKRWWTEGVPLTIRQMCAQSYEAKNREKSEESYLRFINYVEICIENWDLLKDVCSLGARQKDNKRENTKWIAKINDLRQITSHPERGSLNAGQVDYLEEIYEKVLEFFPNADDD